MAPAGGSELYAYIVEALLIGAWVTIVVGLGAMLVSVAAAAVLASLHSFSGRITRGLVYIFVEFFRAIPVLTLLFILYFGLATLGFRLGSITAAIIGLGINGTAYCTEIFRAGIEAIPRGQVEAAQSIGLRRAQVMRYVVLPQAVRLVLPALTNLSIQILKNTSVASAVAAPEIMLRARNLVNETYLSPEIYFSVCIVYLCMTLPMMRFAAWLETRVGVTAAKR